MNTDNEVPVEDKPVYLFGIPYENLPTYRRADPVGDVPVKRPSGINYDLLDEILNFIKIHPQTWKQASWFAHVDRNGGNTRFYVKEEEVTDANVCGSSFCFAGHVAIASGFPLPPKSNDESWSRQVVTQEDSWTEDVSEFATQILGLTYEQSEALFSGDNDLEDLEWYVAVLHALPDVDGDVMNYCVNEYEVNDFVERYEELKNDFYENF